MEIFAGLFVFALLAYGIYRFIQRERETRAGGKASGGGRSVKEK